ncbi:MAG: hypothetical protein AB1542_08655 [Pseudomonadota bacterium]
MSKSYPDARPTWFRLSEDSWAQIADAYKNGATAGELSAKWKVSARTIYRYASLYGWTKKAHGDAVAREHAAAVEAEAEASRRAALVGVGALPGELWLTGDEDDDDEAPSAFGATFGDKAAFDPAFAAAMRAAAPPPPPLSTDPSDLKAATLARLAAAIRAGRDQEALRLTTLLERLSKLSAPEETPVETPAGATDDWRPRRLDPMGYTGHSCVDPIKDPERARLLMTGFVDWRPSPAQVEHEAACMFRSIFLIALCMLLKPHAVPPLLLRRVYRFRRDYLGEDDAEAMRHAERISTGVMREYEQPYRIFLDTERRPIRKLAYRTWPPPRPPYPSRKDLAKEATPLPLAEP